MPQSSSHSMLAVGAAVGIGLLVVLLLLGALQHHHGRDWSFGRGGDDGHSNDVDVVSISPHDLVNHSDFFLDVFPLDMTKEMHRRVLCIRRTLRKEISDFDALRAPEPVTHVKQLGDCHRIRKQLFAKLGEEPSEAELEAAEAQIPVMVGDIFTDGLGAYLLRRRRTQRSCDPTQHRPTTDPLTDTTTSYRQQIARLIAKASRVSTSAATAFVRSCILDYLCVRVAFAD